MKILTMLSPVGSRVSAQAIVVAIGLMICGARAAGAGSLPPDQFDGSLASMASADASEEPFGLSTTALPESPVQEKWTVVEHDIAADMKTVTLCRSDRARCPSAAALRFLSIIDSARGREGLARLGEINRSINLAIRPMSDLMQYHVEDLWSSPLATLAAGAGDCEDYAIAKFVALREAGVAPDDLRLVIMRNTLSGEDHAVAAVRFEGHWRLLDNRYLVMLKDEQIRRYHPTFVIDEHQVRRFVEPPIVKANELAAAGRSSKEPGIAANRELF
jgi:predicted transglutaminase-like cysteine proteinase